MPESYEAEDQGVTLGEAVPIPAFRDYEEARRQLDRGALEGGGASALPPPPLVALSLMLALPSVIALARVTALFFALIAHRDTQSYMGILLDDNNRKPLVRLHFNRARKQIGVFDEKRKEERIPIDSLNDIYKHGDKMKRVLAFYERERAAGRREPEQIAESGSSTSQE